MFSESRNDQRHFIGDRAAADRLRDRDNAEGMAITPQKRDPMLNSVLNGDCCNSVPRRPVLENK